MELKLYLETDFTLFEQSDGDELDILQWWKSHAKTFPILSMLARDVLSIPVSTVSSEQAFSTTGRIIEERRTCLTPEMVEVLTCVKDWEHADLRIQHQMENEEMISHFSFLNIGEGSSSSNQNL